MATRQFEGAFERAGKPHMDRRLAAARGYYQKYANNSGMGGLGSDDIRVKSQIPDSNFTISSPKDLFDNGFSNTIGMGGLNSLLNTVAQTAKTNGNNDIVNYIISIVNLLTEIAINTRQTTENTASIVNRESNTTVVSTNNNNISSNPMFDIAKQRKEERTKSNYEIAKLIAQGIR